MLSENDPFFRKIYWGLAESQVSISAIQRMNMNGSNTESIIDLLLGISGFAYDNTGKNC